MTRKRLLSLVFIGTIMFSNFALLSNLWTQVPKKAQIAFESDRDGNFEVYVMDTNGRNPRNLTLHPSSDSSPAWAPDGKQIAFVSSRTGNAEIHIMDADGKNVRKITNYLDFDYAPTWSPDGRQIAFDSTRDDKNFFDPNAEIYVMDADGGNVQKLTQHLARDRFPAWSSDGRQIAFVSNRGNRDKSNIYIMDRDGSNGVQFTDFGDAWKPAWSPDGRRIAFNSSLEGTPGIYVMDIDGKNRRNLTPQSNFDWDPDWFDPEVPPYAVSTLGKCGVTWGLLKVRK